MRSIFSSLIVFASLSLPDLLPHVSAEPLGTTCTGSGKASSAASSIAAAPSAYVASTPSTASTRSTSVQAQPQTVVSNPQQYPSPSTFPAVYGAENTRSTGGAIGPATAPVSQRSGTSESGPGSGSASGSGSGSGSGSASASASALPSNPAGSSPNTGNVSTSSTRVIPATDFKDNRRFIAYWSAYAVFGKDQAPLKTLIEPEVAANLTHLIVFAVEMPSPNAFWESDLNPWKSPFNYMNSTLQRMFKSTISQNALFEDPQMLRSRLGLSKNVKVMACIGGWGYDVPFRWAVETDDRLKAFSKAIVRWVIEKGFDGVDIDWEYPGGGGNDPLVTHGQKNATMLQRHVDLLKQIRLDLKTWEDQNPTKDKKLLSIAVGTRTPDIENTVANKQMGKDIDDVVDFVNLMTYDHLNRRDTATAPHAGLTVIRQAVAAYSALGVPTKSMNVGWTPYAKYFSLPLSQTTCAGYGCQLDPSILEWTNPQGVGNCPEFNCTGGTSLSNVVCFNSVDYLKQESQIKAPYSTSAAIAKFSDGNVDKDGNADFWVQKVDGTDGPKNDIFWTWVSPKVVEKTCPTTFSELQVGGQMMFSLGQDFLPVDNKKTLGSALISCMRS